MTEEQKDKRIERCQGEGQKDRKTERQKDKRTEIHNDGGTKRETDRKT